VLAKQQKATIPQDILTSSGRTLTAFGNVDENFNLRSPRLRGEARLVFRAILGG
jgi:CRISPR/Cas system CMR-associated protein Cmr1 (group 7 of RAMP superfamily)